jgi:hypothetical protein
MPARFFWVIGWRLVDNAGYFGLTLFQFAFVSRSLCEANSPKLEITR